LSSAGNLNVLLGKVADVAASEGERRGYERAIRETPALVDGLTEKTMSLREAAHDFLDANKDLIPVRSFLGIVVNEYRAKNPEWTIEKLFTEAGDEVRKRLELSKVVKEIDDQDGAENKGAFAKRGAGSGGGTRKGTGDKLSPLQKEINELAEFVEGK